MSTKLTEVYQPPRSADPLRLQDWLVHKAMHRGRWRQRYRCWRGKHNPPHDRFVLDGLGRVMIGGICVREGCDDPRHHMLTWIGNTWDFPQTIERIDSDGVEVGPLAFDDAVQAHIDWLHRS